MHPPSMLDAPSRSNSRMVRPSGNTCEMRLVEGPEALMLLVRMDQRTGLGVAISRLAMVHRASEAAGPGRLTPRDEDFTDV